MSSITGSEGRRRKGTDAERVWQPRASVYIGEKEWDERDEILAEEGMNVCPAIHTPIYRIASERERARAFIIGDGIGVALRRMKGLIEQREGAA